MKFEEGQHIIFNAYSPGEFWIGQIKKLCAPLEAEVDWWERKENEWCIRGRSDLYRLGKHNGIANKRQISQFKKANSERVAREI